VRGISLRARLLITSVALVAIGLVAAGVATHRVMRASLIDRTDEQLMGAVGPATRALDMLEGPFYEGPGPAGIRPPPGTLVLVLDPSGDILVNACFAGVGNPCGYPDLPRGLPGSTSNRAGRATFLTVSSQQATGGYGFRLLALPRPRAPGTLVIAIGLGEIRRTLESLLVAELIIGGVVLILVAGLAQWLVRVGLRPLEGIGETAGAIAAGDLSRRVEPADERTEIGRLGLALNAMLAQIEAAFEERGASQARLRRFVADASHELRTPLTSIRGYSELFRRGAGSRPDDLAKTMERIEAEAARMGILVDDLLLLARLDQGRPLEREPVDLAAVVAEAVEAARAVEPDRRIELEADGPMTLTGDEGRLRQVVDNLLDNARVHAPGAATRVRLAREDGEAVLTVRDEGPGIPSEVAGRAFERFYRGDPARSRQTGGAGLGLSIVAAIVEAHGGTVTATSPDAGGAVFEVRLPAS
jgi:two-component system OmpR family sensor kinase